MTQRITFRIRIECTLYWLHILLTGFAAHYHLFLWLKKGQAALGQLVDAWLRRVLRTLAAARQLVQLNSSPSMNRMLKVKPVFAY
jgi:hypothetical protein